MTLSAQPIVEVRDVKKYFRVPRGTLRAVDGVSFSIERGETLGLVGESGCGKSTTGRVVLNLIPATAGTILFNGEDVTNSVDRRKRREMQIIFQDPYSSLDPRKTVGKIIEEPLVIQGIPRRERASLVKEIMADVGLSADYYTRFPHELDGGRRQRVGIARALILKPKFVVCDEPVSALDVSIQAQILNLLQDLGEQMGLTYLFISHNLSVVKHLSRRVAVMYLGKIVELADTNELFKNPLHPYTRALLAAVPIPKYRPGKAKMVLSGDVPSPIDPKPGCRFAPRCPEATEVCSSEDPLLRDAGAGHLVSCHLVRYH